MESVNTYKFYQEILESTFYLIVPVLIFTRNFTFAFIHVPLSVLFMNNQLLLVGQGRKNTKHVNVSPIFGGVFENGNDEM